MTQRRLLFTLLGVVGVVWASAPVVLYFSLPDWQERGQFGDLFGSVNALFSGLAFAILGFTLYQQQQQMRMQRIALSLQRRELRLQREEMAATRGELASQAKAQRALFKATVAQIVVAAAEARIKAQEIQAPQLEAFGRRTHIDFIEATANSLDALANKLEADAE